MGPGEIPVSAAGVGRGAIEANCVNFIDKALAHEEKSALGMVRQNVAALDRHCALNRGQTFCKLTYPDQDSVLISLEDSQVPDWPAPAGDSADFFGFISMFGTGAGSNHNDRNVF